MRKGSRGKRFKQMGLLHLGDRPPLPVNHGTIQRCFTERTIPRACPACGNTVLIPGRSSVTDPIEGRRLSCPICAWDAFLVSDPRDMLASGGRR